MDNQNFINEDNTPSNVPSNNKFIGYFKLLVILLIIIFIGNYRFVESKFYFLVFFSIMTFGILFIYSKYKNKQENNNESVLKNEAYIPKIKRHTFYIWIIILNVILNPLFLIIMNPDPYEFGGVAAFIFLVAIQIIVSILVVISYEILRKTEKDGSKYNPNNHPFIYNIITLVSIMILLVTIFSSIAYLLPLIKNYQSFNIVSSIKQNTDLWMIDFRSLQINSILKNNYILIRYIIVFLSSITLFLSTKKYLIARVCFLWLVSIILIINNNLFDTNVYTEKNINKIKSIQVERIIKYEQAMKINSCAGITNLDDKKLCDYYLEKRN